MARFLTFVCVLLVVSLLDPARSWSDPRPQEYDVDRELSGSGDDDEPHIEAAPVSLPSAGGCRAHAEMVSQPRAALVVNPRHRVAPRWIRTFFERLAAFASWRHELSRR